MRERDTDDYLAEFLVFGEPNDAMMDIRYLHSPSAALPPLVLT